MHDDPTADLTEPVTAGPRPVEPVADASTRWPVEPVELSPDPAGDSVICPFLRAVDESDGLLLPILAPDPVNRCASSGEPVPQSLRQQELVCLTSGHVNCPRFVRGSVQAPHAIPVRIHLDRPIRVTPATAGAIAVFLVAFAISLGFMVANGGLALNAAATPSPSQDVLAAVETTPPPTSEPTSAPTPAATTEPTASPSPQPSPTPTATPVATPSPSTPPTAPKPTTRPKSGRYALLKPCPNQSDCWIYTIRSGDNLFSIANYFGVPLATVKAWNPWTANGLTVGRALRIPPPTR